MRHGLVCMGLVMFAGLSLPTEQQQTQDKSKEPPAATEAAKSDAAKPDAATAPPAATAERKNPVKATPEGLAAAKKTFGYDCAMCHGPAGDGKGDVAASMNLTVKDWHDP